MPHVSLTRHRSRRLQSGRLCPPYVLSTHGSTRRASDALTCFQILGGCCQHHGPLSLEFISPVSKHKLVLEICTFAIKKADSRALKTDASITFCQGFTTISLPSVRLRVERTRDCHPPICQLLRPGPTPSYANLSALILN